MIGHLRERKVLEPLLGRITEGFDKETNNGIQAVWSWDQRSWTSGPPVKIGFMYQMVLALWI